MPAEKAEQAYAEAVRRCREAEASGASTLAFNFPLVRWLEKLPPELERLTALQTLKLSGCVQIRDLEPLAVLTALQTLNLTGCVQISDLGPLAVLTALQTLNLTGCRQIRDLEPLAVLTELQTLNLSLCVQISDL